MVRGIRSKLLALLLGLLCLALPGALFGQGGGGTFTGLVSDPTGAVVPNANVTVTNQATGVKYQLKTNSAGNYYIGSLIPGNYTIEVSAQGFRNYSNRNLQLTTDQTQRIDVTLEVGAETQTVTVESAAPLVNTEAGRLSDLVSSIQVNNLPLNGRNVYSLMQLVPGAVNSTAVDFEASAGGVQTNINGGRANFNGFLLDGVTNKGLSGGSNSQPAPDFVQEFRIETNNFSAEYSDSAASITDVTTKSGTNEWHGDAWEFLRNDKLNARNFFDSSEKSPFKLNQFGATIGGPIKKDKLFIFGGYEGERFRTSLPAQYFIDSPQWHQAVIAGAPNSAAALLYQNFPGPQPQFGTETLDQYLTNNSEFGSIAAYTDPCEIASSAGPSVGIPAFAGGPNWGNPQTVANNLAAILGVTQSEHDATVADIAAHCPGSGFVAPPVQNGTFSRTDPIAGFVNATNASRASGVFFNGDQYTVRGDYQGDKNRVSARWYFNVQKNPNASAATSGVRGFQVASSFSAPGGAISYVHTFSPTVVNEVNLGFTRNRLTDAPAASQFGVPDIGFDTGEPQFGAYNGYPQIFTEDVYQYRDMLTLIKGKHSIKIGVEHKRNYENSEFNVGRPSYYFFDPIYFAADLPYIQAAGVNPELGLGPNQGHLDTNIRGWRNWEIGAFFQDDVKVTKTFTLNLGLRWDYFSPHTEKYNHATRFLFGPGDNPTSRLESINCETFTSAGCLQPPGDANTPNGGFTTASSLFPSHYKNFAPRVGFAWDPFGTGKTSVRGGAGFSYESSFYNALSNSRWNLPFYSFNEACPICGIDGLPTYGPTNPDGTPSGAAPTYSGPPNNPGQGPAGGGFAGNLEGWLPTNPNLAVLTGIPSPTYTLPYAEQFFLGVQHELSPSTVLEINGVMTLGRHLFWAENPNRIVGGVQATATGTAGRLDACDGSTHFNTGLANPCFGTLRTWETSVNSSYDALQVSLNRRFSHGLAFISNYTWSHSLDFRSSWHALTSGGSATEADPFGSSGYSLDPNRLFLEHASSLFDIRHRLVGSMEWDLPFMKDQQGFAGHILGGWTVNTVVSLQTGFPFTVGAKKDYNGDGLRNDRPNAPTTFSDSRSFSSSQVEAGSGASGGASSVFSDLQSAFLPPTPGVDGNLGRNTFRGPGLAETDFSLFKRIPLGSEQRYLQFRAEFFNLFNRTNLGQPDARLGSGTFGLATTTSTDPREIQFGLKFYF